MTADAAPEVRSVRLNPGTGAALAAMALALSAVFADAPGQWLAVESPPGPADVALVLAGDPGYERTRAAATMWHRGEVSLLIVTGGEPSPGDSTSSLRDTAVSLGVPSGRVLAESVSRNTREAMLAVRPLLHRLGVRRIAIVTSPYHQRRAGWAARRALGDVVVVDRPARPSQWSPEGWWREPRSRRVVLQEYAKLAYYILRGWA